MLFLIPFQDCHIIRITAIFVKENGHENHNRSVCLFVYFSRIFRNLLHICISLLYNGGTLSCRLGREPSEAGVFMNILSNSVLTVHTDRLRRNISSIARRLPQGSSIIAVLKGDAYGLGLVPCAKVLDPLPEVRMFAVAHVSEGLALREAGIQKDILVMAPALREQWAACTEAGLTLSVGRLGMVSGLAALGRSFRVQLKLETGLNRVGLLPDELPLLIEELSMAGDAVRVEGVYSHFSRGSDAALCRAQFEVFQAGTAALKDAGVSVPMRHISSSESSELFPEYDLDAVRLGRRLFMDNPVPNGSVEEVMEWKTRVLDIRCREGGDTVGYENKRLGEGERWIADIGAGYGDGFPLGLAEKQGCVLIGGQRCPVITVCMDQTLVDVTDVECCVGDEVTIFGTDEFGNTLTSQEQALVYGGNEGCSITAGLMPRVYREYL